jgi:hypothetical protein
VTTADQHVEVATRSSTPATGPASGQPITPASSVPWTPPVSAPAGTGTRTL